MNALIRKEVRLMLPAWLAAWGLSALPFFVAVLNAFEPTSQTHIHFGLYTVPIGCAILGLSVFGREFSAGVFSLLLVQPRPRREFWNAKLLVLGVGVFSVLLTVALTSFPFLPHQESEKLLGMWTLAAVVAATGALWLTLLLRQLLAAFWLALLAPLAITLLISALPDEDVRKAVLIFVLVIYSGASLLLGKKLFLSAQDVAWTGGTLTLPTPRSWRSRRGANGLRRSPPLVALLRKEIQFQQVSVVLAALLFVANVGVLGCQSALTVERDSLWNLLFDVFWFLWFILPLMVGCAAVAEERQLGTLEPQLCLPVSRTKQFLAKLAGVVVSALLLGTIPMLLIHFIALGLGLKGNGLWTDPDARYVVPTACVVISLIAFYASTLSRHFLQALAVTIGCLVGSIVLGNLLLIRPPTIGGYTLWEGQIGIMIAGAVALLCAFSLISWRGRWRLFLGLICLGVLLVLGETLLRGNSTLLTILDAAGSAPGIAGFLVVAGPLLLLLVLAFRNFRHVHSGAGLWWKNISVWVAGLLLTTVLASAAYHRVWELVMRFEPAPGPARLSGNVRPMITKYFRSGWLLALLPDGRLWALREHQTYPPSGEWTGHESYWTVNPIKQPRPEIVGSNWLHLALSLFDGAGVQSDGTLWRVSWWESVGPDGDAVPAGAGNWYQKDRRLRQTPMRLSQIGTDTNWLMVAAGNAHFVALKQDGTIWGWGNNQARQLGDGLPATVGDLARLGTDADWGFVAASASGSIAVKRNRSVWKWGQAYPITSRGIGKAFIGGVPKKIATLPARATQIISSHISDVFICADGSAWGVGQLGENFIGAPFRFEMVTELTKLGADDEWSEIEFVWPMYAVALKSDGSLWRQGYAQSYLLRTRPPLEPIGTRTDWIAARIYGDAVYALAKDGTLCRFGEESYGNEPKLTGPTRRVTWSLNVLDSAK